jgi:hypothetical protein
MRGQARLFRQSGLRGHNFARQRRHLLRVAHRSATNLARTHAAASTSIRTAVFASSGAYAPAHCQELINKTHRALRHAGAPELLPPSPQHPQGARPPARILVRSHMNLALRVHTWRAALSSLNLPAARERRPDSIAHAERKKTHTFGVADPAVALPLIKGLIIFDEDMARVAVAFAPAAGASNNSRGVNVCNAKNESSRCPVPACPRASHLQTASMPHVAHSHQTCTT